MLFFQSSLVHPLPKKYNFSNFQQVFLDIATKTFLKARILLLPIILCTVFVNTWHACFFMDKKILSIRYRKMLKNHNSKKTFCCSQDVTRCMIFIWNPISFSIILKGSHVIWSQFSFPIKGTKVSGMTCFNNTRSSFGLYLLPFKTSHNIPYINH